MKLSLISMTKQPNGVIEIVVNIYSGSEFKTYTYFLDSEYIYEKFLFHYRAQRYGRAITILNKMKVK